MASSGSFFEKQEKHSLVKSEIVSNYFVGWAKALSKHCQRFTYIDLFSGPGKFEDGKSSTPLLILDKVKNEQFLRGKVSLYFYESDRNLLERLQDHVSSHSASNLLASNPVFCDIPVSMDMVSSLPRGKCTMSFIDPYGIQGISLQLLWKMLADWGNDVIFLLSTSAIRRFLGHESLRESLESIFSEDQISELQSLLENHAQSFILNRRIIECLRTQLMSRLGKQLYLVPFWIDYEVRNDISHVLVMASKDPRGFEIMKDVVDKKCEHDGKGIPTWEFSHFAARKQYVLDLDDSFRMNELIDKIKSTYHGYSGAPKEIWDGLNVAGELYVKRNVKDAIEIMVSSNAASFVRGGISDKTRRYLPNTVVRID